MKKTVCETIQYLRISTEPAAEVMEVLLLNSRRPRSAIFVPVPPTHLDFSSAAVTIKVKHDTKNYFYIH